MRWFAREEFSRVPGRITLFVAIVCPLVGANALGQVTMDGSLVGDNYGSALSIQTTNTQFGDAQLGDTVEGGGGSEIDGFYAKIENNRLYMMVTGNLETNFNKLDFFFDTRAGGVNGIVGSQLPRGVDGFCCGGLGTQDGALQRLSGLGFDAGFEADYFLTMSHGYETALDDPSAPGNPIQFWTASAHYAESTAGADPSRQSVAAGMQLAPTGLPNVLRSAAFPNFSDLPALPDGITPTVPSLIGPALPGLSRGQLIDRNYALSSNGGCLDDTGAGCLATELGFALDISPSDPTNSLSHRNFDNVIDLQMAINNSNFDGVNGNGPYTDPTTTDPGAVTTGIEFSIPLSEIGNPTGDFKVMAFINGNSHSFLSNQFIGDGILMDNPGSPTTTNLAQIPGDQFVTVSFTSPFSECDFNGSGMCDGDDIDLLIQNIAIGPPDPGTYDLTNDGLVNRDDRDEWLVQAGAENLASQGAYLLGDANLDGVVDGQDFIDWNTNKFTSQAAWTRGDFSADGLVDGQDFILWNTNKFQSADGIAAVPEPATGVVGLSLGLLLGLRGLRK